MKGRARDGQQCCSHHLPQQEQAKQFRGKRRTSRRRRPAHSSVGLHVGWLVLAAVAAVLVISGCGGCGGAVMASNAHAGMGHGEDEGVQGVQGVSDERLTPFSKAFYWMKRVGCPNVRRMSREEMRKQLTAPMMAHSCNALPVIGQDVAVETTTNAITSYQEREKTSPMVLFMAGPAGVGKTFLMSKLYDLLFTEPVVGGRQRAIFSVLGYAYSKSDKPTRSVMRSIARQLLRCPDSIIIIEELELLPQDVLTSIHMFLDRQQPVYVDDIPVHSNRAMFVFSTNAGHSVMRSETAKLLATRPRKELRHRDFAHLLQAIMAESNAWLAHKGVVDLYVPFLPMTRAEVRTFILHRFKEYECRWKLLLTYDEGVLTFLVEEISYDAQGFSVYGLSRIDKPLLLVEVKGPLMDLVQSHKASKKAGAGRLERVHMSLSKRKRVVFQALSGPARPDSQQHDEL